ncbi:hypothetical protein BH11PLA2_BH11PLA2_52130 [soil metagenome]
MNATVGAFVEEAPVRRRIRGADAAAMLSLLVLATLLHGYVVRHTCVTARDSMRFARTALNLESPNVKVDMFNLPHRGAVEVLKDAKECPDPPGYPVAVLAVSKIVRLSYDAPLADQMLLSAQIASSFAAVLLVLPTYWLGRLLFGSAFIGFAAAILFQVLPTSAHVLSDGLSDSFSLLGISTALVFGVRAVQTMSTFNTLMCGIASGCAYLVRPEGVLVMLAVGAVISVLALGKQWARTAALGRLTALMIGVMLPAAPYMALINGVSNKPSVIDAIQKLTPWRAKVATAEAPHTVLLAEWYTGQGSQLGWAATAIFKETFKTAHYAPFVLAIYGLFLCRSKFRTDPGFALVAVLGVMHTLLLFVLAMKPMPADLSPGVEAVPPYISERHTLLLAYLASLFAACTLPKLSRFKYGSCVLLAGLIASALPTALRPLHENRNGHIQAGHFLAGQIAPTDALIDPFDWAQWYAGRMLYAVPLDPPDDLLTARWVVWEPTAGTKQNPHSRLPRLEVARNVVNDGGNPPVLMFQWPPNVPPEQAKVVVYKQMVKR